MVGALFVNYVLMAHLALKLVSMRWGEFVLAHVRGLGVAAIAGGGAVMLASTLRDAGRGDLSVLVGTVGVMALAVLGMAWLWPAGVLGADGREVAKLMRSGLARSTGKGGGQRP
ncbi:MAG: hypothetical protein D6701_07090 [Gemmatimonadetes bacterium]|nr:MAG: hypothetical protein D6701_07090 [Gemmatimonadota bacterium]